jgi:membrane protease YdiL (CAAX protease family)
MREPLAMPDASVAFVTPAAAPAWKRRLVYSPPARFVIFAVLFVAAMFLIGGLMHALGFVTHATALSEGVAQFAMRALAPLLAYLVLVKGIERRSLDELAPRKLLPQGLFGIVAGALLFGTVVGVLWSLGSYRVTVFDPQAAWLPPLLTAGLGAGIGEEIMFRGVLFRVVEEDLGTWAALLVSALFFGFAHAGNPGATVWSSAAIAIEAGLLFALLYHLTRSLPLCMGVHAAWNFCQGTVYGIPVSGIKADGWLVSTRTGPDWLSGGVFGAEASVVALALCSLCSAGLLVVALRRHSFVPPCWRRG